MTGTYEAIRLPDPEEMTNDLHDSLCQSLGLVEENDIQDMASASQIHRLSEKAKSLLEDLEEIVGDS